MWHYYMHPLSAISLLSRPMIRKLSVAQDLNILKMANCKIGSDWVLLIFGEYNLSSICIFNILPYVFVRPLPWTNHVKVLVTTCYHYLWAFKEKMICKILLRRKMRKSGKTSIYFSQRRTYSNDILFDYVILDTYQEPELALSLLQCHLYNNFKTNVSS